MTSQALPTLCGIDNCRLLVKHKGKHNPYPTAAWDFMQDKDRKKLNKAGFATPRGGAKGAYQNHVTRSSRVIVPFEKIPVTDLSVYGDGYIIRLFPEQYFEAAGQPKSTLIVDETTQNRVGEIEIGKNAFVNYRFHSQLQKFPPMAQWRLRSLEKEGNPTDKRNAGVADVGHYTKRIPKHGQLPKDYAGAVQGIFAPEYATAEINYLSKCVLAWLILHTEGSPYVTAIATHLKAILEHEELLNDDVYEYKSVLRRGICCCPLCLRFIRYEDLHKMALFENEQGEDNAAEQVEGATRSTIVNLFHLNPLKYSSISHAPANVAWGHHICNTRLGQRACLSLAELIESNRKVAVIGDEGIDTFGWISDDDQMIRGPEGAVWIQIVDNMSEAGMTEVEQSPGMDETFLISDEESSVEDDEDDADVA